MLHRGRYGRREWLKGAAAVLLATAGCSPARPAERPQTVAPASISGLETTRIRLVQTSSMCQVAQYAAEDLLRDAGFTEVTYVKKPGPSAIGPALASGEVDINMHFSGPLLTEIDAGHPIVVLAGVHIGCFELFGTDGVRAIHDLKGKSVVVPERGSGPDLFLASMLAYVGLDPEVDVTWQTYPPPQAIQMLADGRVDGYLGFPTDPQEMRARHIGHVVVNSMLDRPWSEYFCCLVAANSNFVARNPVATRRALGAILTAADQTQRDPVAAVQLLVDRGYTTEFDYTLAAVQAIHSYNWRDYDAEDSLRFYALRLHEAHRLQQDPKQLIIRGTDWRPFADVKADVPAPAALAYCPIPIHA